MGISHYRLKFKYTFGDMLPTLFLANKAWC